LRPGGQGNRNRRQQNSGKPAGAARFPRWWVNHRIIKPQSGLSFKLRATHSAIVFPGGAPPEINPSNDWRLRDNHRS
jgi:hypothetical protein